MDKNTAPISIIAQGFILSEFLTEFVFQLKANPDQSLESFYKNYESKIGSQYSKGENVIFTPGSLLGLLYLMIVYPQQKFHLKNPTLGFDAILQKWGNPEIKIWNDSDKRELHIFIRRLRNSISHGRVQFDDSMNIIFEDAPSKDNKKKNKERGKVDFSVSMSLDGLKKFTEKLAYEIKLDC
ncbi:MAG: hypothetical protein JXI43_07820 [Tissierellales bacterium]|nr:hypothetical protein [Tissierellales bacterium]